MSAKFDNQTGRFNGSYVLDSNISAPTIVFFSIDYWYFTGMVVFDIRGSDGVIIPDTAYNMTFPLINYVGIQFHDSTYHGQTIHIGVSE